MAETAREVAGRRAFFHWRAFLGEVAEAMSEASLEDERGAVLGGALNVVLLAVGRLLDDYFPSMADEFVGVVEKIIGK